MQNPKRVLIGPLRENQRPSEAVSLLKYYLKISNAMLPGPEIEASINSTAQMLWHFDLHLENRCVELSGTCMPRNHVR